MTALTKDRTTRTKAGGAARHGKRGVAAATVIYLGAAIGRNAAGYVVPASDTASVETIGVSEAYVNNAAGAAGDLSVPYVTGIEAEFDNEGGAIVLANLGRPCFIAFDNSVDATGGLHKVIAGIVQEFTAAKVWVFIDEVVNATLTSARGPVDFASVSPALTRPSDLVVIPIDIPNAATTTYVYKTDEKLEFIRMDLIKDAAGAGNTVKMTDGADADISNAVAYAVDKTLTSSGTLDKAKRTIAAGGTFKLVVTNAAGSTAGQAYLYARRA